MPTIDIAMNHRPHRLTIERHLLKRTGQFVKKVAPHSRALLVADQSIRRTHAAVVEESLSDAGYETQVVELEADERKKTLDAARMVYDAMLAHRMDRTSPVVAVGGGLIGDVAGFAAATYLRGVPIVQVPTTLLAMVDASIGGKTAVNHPLPGGELGKNLIGAFWQPAAVLADPETLRTLDERDYRCGIAECIKHALLASGVTGNENAGRELLDHFRDHAETVRNRDLRAMEELINQSAAIKISIVQEDEREAGTRMLLNLGHTFAHAIEAIEELDLRHGEAVAIGLCAAAHLGVNSGRLEPDDQQTIENVLHSFALPTRLPEPIPAATLLNAMGWDKKVKGGRLHMIVPISPLGFSIVDDNVSKEAIHEALEYIGASVAATTKHR